MNWLYKNLWRIGVLVAVLGVGWGVIVYDEDPNTQLEHALSIVGGGIALIGIGVAARRIEQFGETLENQEKTLRGQQEQIAIQERGLFADRLKAGIELLNSDSASQQSDAIEWLHSLAKDRKDSKEDRDLILKILCTFVRVKSRELVDTDGGNLMDRMKDLVREIAEKSVEKCREIYDKMKNCGESIQHKIDNKRAEMLSVHRAIQLISHPDNKDIYDSTQIDLSYSFIWDCKLDTANLKGANLQGVYWDGMNKHDWTLSIDLSEANLNEAYLVRLSDIFRPGSKTGEKRGVLEKAQLRAARLLDLDLFGVNLRHAELSGASVLYSDLKSACLEQADLGHANLNGVSLENVKDLHLAQNLSKVKDWSRSTIDEKYKDMLLKCETSWLEHIIWCCEGGKRYVYRGQIYERKVDAQDVAWKDPQYPK